MNTIKIDGQLLIKLVSNGCLNLKADCDNINALNVFPVPDGDTGTNMKMTIEGGANAIASLSETSIGEVSKKLSKAMTLSARGNSGVILSQFFKGFSLGIGELKEASVKDFANAFNSGVKRSYSVVKNPTEGTILTVMREAGLYAVAHIDDGSTLEEYFNAYLKEARASLKRTPDLLPCLKEAGVVDSGGQGFIRVIEGMAMLLDGKVLENSEHESITGNKSIVTTNFNADSILEYGYCTEFILQLMNAKCDPATFDINTIVSFLETIGNSIVAFKDDSIIKVHVHTMTPGVALNYCQQFGEFVTLKIENMSVQHTDLSEPLTPLNKKEHKKYAVVAVSQGSGITDAFKSMGADEIVSGGQTMNPSTDDFIKAFDNLDAENIYVFPNNSNIIMAAKQAADVYKNAKVYVVPTKSITQCYSSLSMLDYECDDADQIFENFKSAYENLVFGQITYAVRDSETDGVKIKKDDYISIINHKITSSNKDKVEAFKALCKSVEEIEEKQVMVVFYGKDVTDEEKEQIRSYVSTISPFMELGEVEGGQDIYSFIVSVE